MNLSGKKTLKNKFQWTPKHLGYEKGSRPIPPLKIDSRIPKLWITSLPPVKKELKIDGEFTTIEIYDAIGKLVLGPYSKKSIDISSLNNGLYTAILKTKNNFTSKKFTIQK